MEPHVFAGFERLSFFVDLGFEGAASAPALTVDIALNISPQSQTIFIKTVREMNIFSNFVELLGNSHNISHLRMVINPYMQTNEGEDGIPEFAGDDEKGKWWKEYCLFDSDLLMPLTSLRNVQSFELDWDQLDQDCYTLQLTNRHRKLSSDLEKTVEDNWLVAHGLLPPSVKK